MKIYNNKEQFNITFNSLEFTIPKWESECNSDLFYHIKSKESSRWLDVVDASTIKDKSMTYDEYKKDLESQEAKVHEMEDEIDRLKDEERMKKLEEMANVDAPKKKRAWRPKKK